MFRINKKSKPSKYYSSFYRYKKPLPIKRLLTLLVITVVTTFYVIKSHAAELSNTVNQAQLIRLNEIASGQLLFNLSGEGARQGLYQQALILNSAASFDVKGMIATVTLTQSFLNPSDVSTSGLYTFPLPENAAVNYLHIQIGDRVIEGKILEKSQAKRVFARAKKTGKKASLVVQHRPNLFTNHIANIGANEQLTVTLKYVQHVTYSDGQFNLRFPMRITPRYQPSQLAEAPLANQLYQRNANITRLTLPSADRSSVTNSQIQLNVKLNTGVALAQITSPSHKINYQQKEANKGDDKNPSYDVSVGHVTVPMDKDFVLSWQPTLSGRPRVSLFRENVAGEEYALAMILPPSEAVGGNTAEDTHARDVTFIIDTSGSMQGASIEQAKQSLLFALGTLNAKDSFNVIAFESRHHSLFSRTVMATPENIAKAHRFITRLNANGGTEMYRPLDAAINMPMSTEQSVETIRQVIFITDGAVSNEQQLFTLIYSARNLPRLFTVGIGSAPNGYFMRKAAQFGQGSYTYIADVKDVEAKMSVLLNKISKPALRNIALQFHPLHLGAIEQYPNKIPDLYYGEPLLVAIKTQLLPTSVQVFGDIAGQGWHQEVMFKKLEESRDITSVWARSKIENLMDGLVVGKDPEYIKKQVIETSLRHQVMSRYTSFIAVEQESTTPKYKEESSAKQDIAANSLQKSSKRAKVKQQLTTQKINTAQANSISAAPFPKTATGWQLQAFIGLSLLLFSCLVYVRKSSYEA